MHKVSTGEPDPNHASDDIEDWLQNSASFISSLLDYPYNSSDISTYTWWNQSEETTHNPINPSPDLNSTNNNTTTDTIAPNLKPASTPTLSSNSKPSDSSKKRKISDDPVSKSCQSNHQKKNQTHRINKEEIDSDRVTIEEPVATVKRSSGNKKSTNKGGGNNSNNNSRDGRWAEQLLNPCATAITAGNLSRVQHLLYVLNELASPTGDANHRLAYHGLQALTLHISSSINNNFSGSTGPTTFASTEPKFFQRTLFKFNEVSPWFAFPNNIANASIIQILTKEQGHKRGLHILDIGVSHGMQWPTLLEALTRLSEGPPPLVRITVVTSTIENDPNDETPFSVGPPGDNFSTRLLSFAKSMNINLQINVLANHSLQNLSAQVINKSNDEILLVCAQFRLHCLGHHKSDERTQFLNSLRSMAPKGVILCENNMDCSCNSCVDFATGFSSRVEYLWRFLDSTSSAFKGRESEERRMMEGEAAKALTSRGEMNEGKEKWCERMRWAGFVAEVFGEDAADGARALLRKYDSNWEMRMEEKEGCVGLWWKGQPVSFSSLWKLDSDI